jgi:hypothetical protein
LEAALERLGAARDRVAGAIQSLLLGAEFGRHPLSPSRGKALLADAQGILASASSLAAHS